MDQPSNRPTLTDDWVLLWLGIIMGPLHEFVWTQMQILTSLRWGRRSINSSRHWMSNKGASSSPSSSIWWKDTLTQFPQNIVRRFRSWLISTCRREPPARSLSRAILSREVDEERVTCEFKKTITVMLQLSVTRVFGLPWSIKRDLLELRTILEKVKSSRCTQLCAEHWFL